MNRRCGYSLVEMVAVIAVCSVLMAVTVVMFCALMRNQRAGRDHISHSTALGRLADRFHRDVHATPAEHISSENSAEGDLIRLRPDGKRTITYRQEHSRVTRTERTGGGQPRYEIFDLPQGAIASVEIRSDAEPKVVTLLIGSLREVIPAVETEPSEGPPGRSLQIDAVPARDHRFLKQEKP